MHGLRYYVDEDFSVELVLFVSLFQTDKIDLARELKNTWGRIGELAMISFLKPLCQVVSILLSV